MSYTLRNAFNMGPAKTGKSLRGQIVDDAGSNVGSAITTATELTGGLGVFEQICTIPDAQTGFLRIYFSDAPTVFVASIALNPQEIENADAKTSTRSTLTTSDIDARLNAYDAATGTEASAILAAIAALNNLSSAGAQAAAEAALAAYNAATGEDVSALAAILAVTNPDPDEPGEITIQRGTTIDREITVAIIPSSWTSARLTVKRYIGQADSEAVLQILVSSTPSASDGLQILNGSATVTKTDAELTVTYATGKATFHLEDALTAALAVTRLPMWWDIKFYHGSSDSVATMPQHFNVTGIVTEAV